MTKKKPLASLKRKIAIAFYLIFLMTIAVDGIAILLSQHLKQEVDAIISRDVASVSLALKMAKESQKLQIVTARLDNYGSEQQRAELLHQLERQWQVLTAFSEQLADTNAIANTAKLTAMIEVQRHNARQLPLLDTVTKAARKARVQAVALQADVVAMQAGFSQALQHFLAQLDGATHQALAQNRLSKVQETLAHRQQVAYFRHLGERLFSTLLPVMNGASGEEINLAQRNAMRLFRTMESTLDAMQYKRSEIKELSVWLDKIKPSMVGQDNLFQLARGVLNSGTIAGVHLANQNKAAQDLDHYVQQLVAQLENKIDAAGNDLKFDSTVFMVLILVVGASYCVFIWLTNWHFIAKGIIHPVIATSHAMTDIANEKLDTELPVADNLELQQMMSSLETLKSYATQVKIMSEIDGLTGAYNRRYFDNHLAQELVHAKMTGKTFSLILFDIDNFKQFNDSYGHVAGDNCLKEVVKATRTLLRRPSESLSRYGGEEFVVLLPMTGIDRATLIAEQIRTQILALKIPHQSSSTLDVISVSLGVASFAPEQIIQANQLINIVDEALYLAKLKGRNCTQVVT
jgi:diguanylate cyclase (GGDEF)-like protein